jgi:hypothetical protein
MKEETHNKETKDDGKLIRVTKEADDAIQGLLQRISDSMENAKFTKSALASYLIERFSSKFSDEDAKVLYMQMVSELDLLRSAYKQAMETGVIPDNLRDILFANAGLTPSPKKVKKPRRGDGISDTTVDTEAA